MNLPKFTESQQKIVIRKLIEMDSHRVIAQYLQHTFPEFKPKDMDQEEYEQAVIKRCKDYVSNKGRKWFAIIQDGRQKFKEEMIGWAIKELMKISFVADSYQHQDAINAIDMKDALDLADSVWQMMDRIYTPIYGQSDCPGYMDPTKVGVGLRRARMMDAKLQPIHRRMKSAEKETDIYEDQDTESPQTRVSALTDENIIE